MLAKCETLLWARVLREECRAITMKNVHTGIQLAASAPHTKGRILQIIHIRRTRDSLIYARGLIALFRRYSCYFGTLLNGG